MQIFRHAISFWKLKKVKTAVLTVFALVLLKAYVDAHTGRQDIPRLILNLAEMACAKSSSLRTFIAAYSVAQSFSAVSRAQTPAINSLCAPLYPTRLPTSVRITKAPVMSIFHATLFRTFHSTSVASA